MEYRPALTEDAKEISQLIRSLSSSFLANRDGSGAQLFWNSVSEEAQLLHLRDPRYWYVVATHNGDIAGFIAMRDLSHVFHLFVAKERQRQGVASQLWELAKSNKRAVNNTAAFTVNSSLSAAAVYERFGFFRTGDVVKNHGISFCPMQRPTD
jgi:GNAT superfamily N-acetyltransferase